MLPMHSNSISKLALNNPYFQYHLEMAELDLYVAVGINVATKLKNLNRLVSCAVLSTVKWWHNYLALFIKIP